MAARSDNRKTGLLRRLASTLLGTGSRVNNGYWKRELRRKRRDYAGFLTDYKISSVQEAGVAGKRLLASSIPSQELEYASEIAFAAPDDPLVSTYADRAIALCEILSSLDRWEYWANGDEMLAAKSKGQVSRCLAYATWLKNGVLDFQLLREAYSDLWLALGRLIENPDYEWDDLKEGLHLSLLLLLEVLGPEGAGLQPPPQRAKVREVPETYFRAIEDLRKTGPADPATWKSFSDAFELIRHPDLKTFPGELPLLRIEWGILFCRGTNPPTFMPTPKDVLGAIGR